MQVADGRCVPKECCYAKEKYIRSARAYYDAEAEIADAKLELQDYYTDDMNTLRGNVKQEQRKSKEAKVALDAAEAALQRACPKAASP